MRIRQDIPKSFLDNKIYAPDNNLENGGNDSKGGFLRQKNDTNEDNNPFITDNHLTDTIEISGKVAHPKNRSDSQETNNLLNKFILTCAGIFGKKEEMEHLQESIDVYKKRLHKFEEVIGINSNSYTYNNLYNYKTSNTAQNQDKKSPDFFSNPS